MGAMLKVMIAPVTPFQQNCSIVWCDETMEGTAVDPGGDFDMLKEAIAQQGIKVTKVLLTHGHVDHASAAGTMAEHYGVKIEGPHQDDLFLIEGLPDSGRKYNFPAYKPFVPDRWLTNGETVSLGNLTFDVVHCPGHTPGHVVFVHKPAKVAFVGDVLFRGSIGRTRFSARQPRAAPDLDPQAAVAVRRRHHLRARPRPDLDVRLGAQDQPLRRRPAVRRRRRGSEGLDLRRQRLQSCWPAASTAGRSAASCA